MSSLQDDIVWDNIICVVFIETYIAIGIENEWSSEILIKLNETNPKRKKTIMTGNSIYALTRNTTRQMLSHCNDIYIKPINLSIGRIANSVYLLFRLPEYRTIMITLVNRYAAHNSIRIHILYITWEYKMSTHMCIRFIYIYIWAAAAPKTNNNNK